MPIEDEKDMVRLLISDTGGTDGSSYIFSDKEIETFMAMESDVKLAAATALRVIAGNEAMTLKVIDFLELSTDGAKVSESLMKLADKYEEKADDDYDLEFVNMGVDIFSRRQILFHHLTGHVDD